MAKAYPKEFRDDVVRVARKGEGTLSHIAKEFGISEGTLSNWLKRADVEDGHRPGLTETDPEDLRKANSRHDHQQPNAARPEHHREDPDNEVRQISTPLIDCTQQSGSSQHRRSRSVDRG